MSFSGIPRSSFRVHHFCWTSTPTRALHQHSPVIAQSRATSLLDTANRRDTSTILRQCFARSKQMASSQRPVAAELRRRLGPLADNRRFTTSSSNSQTSGEQPSEASTPNVAAGQPRVLQVRSGGAPVSPTSTPTSESPSPSSPEYIPDRYLTVPNAMTVVRMLLAPYVGYSIVGGEYVTAFWTTFVAGALDGLDGWVARRFNQQSVIGSYIDPVADKLLLMITTVALGYQLILSPYLIFVIVGRDVLLLSGGLYMRHLTKPAGVAFFSTSHPDTLKVEPTTLSKANTALQLATCCAGLTSAAWGLPAPMSTEGAFALAGLSWVTAATTIGSGWDYWLHYGPGFRQRLAQARREREEKRKARHQPTQQSQHGNEAGQGGAHSDERKELR